MRQMAFVPRARSLVAVFLTVVVFAGAAGPALAQTQSEPAPAEENFMLPDGYSGPRPLGFWGPSGERLGRVTFEGECRMVLWPGPGEFLDLGHACGEGTIGLDGVMYTTDSETVYATAPDGRRLWQQQRRGISGSFSESSVLLGATETCGSLATKRARDTS